MRCCGMPELIQPLRSGPLDIIGDIHGEIGALETLLVRLGYDASGVHPDGRHLVFVGDLVDRGHDSPAVVRRVAGLVASGAAQGVLGNHELNLLLGKRKEGNGWFFDDDHDRASGHFLTAPSASEDDRISTLAFLETLPIGLEREDLRVVHACWATEAANALRGDSRPVAEAFADHSDRLDAELQSSGAMGARDAERSRWKAVLGDRNASVPFMPGIAAVDSARQSAHPLKVMTSGIERPTATPFFASGKWRMTERMAWWNDYRGDAAVVIGHYWRWPGDETDAAARSRGPNLFEGTHPLEWLGPLGNVMCVDWCAGLRWRERAEGVSEHTGRLGALRWPERELVFDR